MPPPDGFLEATAASKGERLGAAKNDTAINGRDELSRARHETDFHNAEGTRAADGAFCSACGRPTAPLDERQHRPHCVVVPLVYATTSAADVSTEQHAGWSLRRGVGRRYHHVRAEFVERRGKDPLAPIAERGAEF